ncbi:hypothetical protein [Chitinophaga japonensis]|uniref:Antitoxin Phd_YefM of type II toxin-antitoxin system n=1 Tax=Chitinophaga japonensis TaxID=104662 RepID=A0A562T6M4_CHIJA|nr:hypothetical protein [Chitinophaga japonensis]TWI88904.1 hypothetical protein LX66_2994 [Chitinophaga japonensis]
MKALHIRKRGDRVSLPEKEFKKLLAKAEELDDIKAYDRAMKKINSGKAEFVTLEEVLKDMPKPKSKR